MFPPFLIFVALSHIELSNAVQYMAKGSVKDFRFKAPIQNLTVHCYDSDPFGRAEYMGSGLTAHNGAFLVELDPASGDRFGLPDVYCVIQGPRISPEIYTDLAYPDENQIVDFGAVYAHLIREYPNCMTNGCGPVVRGYNLDWLVPDLWFTEACHAHDCCMMDCTQGNHTVERPSLCNEEFYDLLYARCRSGSWPAFCHSIAKIYEYAVNRYDNWKHWCLIQRDYCGLVEHEKCTAHFYA